MAATGDSMRDTKEVLFFPVDLVFQILSWLPVISLLRFKSVSKSWNAIIQSSDFVDQHLRHRQSRRHDQTLLRLNARYCLPGLVNSDTNFTRFGLFQGQDFQVLSPIDSPPGLNRPFWHMNMFSCNGLVFLMHGDPSLDQEFDFLLWNPATKQSRVLAPPEFGGRYPFVGFGCDVLTNDYKIVLLYMNKADATSTRCKIVYSLIKDSWSYMQLEDDLYFCTHRRATYWNGSCSWIKSNESTEYCVLSFDFGNEQFYIRPLPDSCKKSSITPPKLAILGDTVACIKEVLVRAPALQMMYEIWMLNEDGPNEYWTNVYRVGPFSFLFSVELVTFLNDGEFLLLETDQQLCIYNLVTGETKSLPREENSYDLIGVILYLDSLVSVEGGRQQLEDC